MQSEVSLNLIALLTMPRQPSPRKLLSRISIILFGTAASTSVHPRKGDPIWRAAALEAWEDVCQIREKHFPEPA